VSGNLPAWPGASAVYSYLYAVLQKLGAEAASERPRKIRRNGLTCTVPEEMRMIASALDVGNEETLKSIQLRYKLTKVGSPALETIGNLCGGWNK
jgi:hypothetical protein